MPRWSTWWSAALVLLLGAPLPAQTTTSVLEALAMAQQADGSWGQTHGDGPAALRDPTRLVTTALVLEAYLSAGYDPVTPNRYSRWLRRGFDVVIQAIGADGRVSEDDEVQAWVTLTLAECYDIDGDAGYGAAAHRVSAAFERQLHDLQAATRPILAHPDRSPNWPGPSHLLPLALALRSCLGADLCRDPGILPWMRTLCHETWLRTHAGPPGWEASAWEGDTEGAGCDRTGELATALGFLGIRGDDPLLDALCTHLEHRLPCDPYHRFLTAMAIRCGRDPGTRQAWMKATALAIGQDHADGFVAFAPTPRAPRTAPPGLRGLDPRVAANVLDWLTLAWGMPPQPPNQRVAPLPPPPPPQ